MKKFAATTIAALAGLSSRFELVSGQVEIRSPGITNYAPFLSLDEGSGEFVGMLKDITDALEENLQYAGITFTYEVDPDAEALGYTGALENLLASGNTQGYNAVLW
jgi:hypothetical protein